MAQLEPYKVLFYRAQLSDLSGEDCVGDFCNGASNIHIADLDGSFLGDRAVGSTADLADFVPGASSVSAAIASLVQRTGVAGTVIPVAETGWDLSGRDDRIPAPMKTTPAGSAIALDVVRPQRGLYRGDGNGTACSLEPGWNAYACRGDARAVLVFESLDSDSKTRNIAPLFLKTGEYASSWTSAKDFGWCSGGFTCRRRLSLFGTSVPLRRDTEAYFSGSNPERVRMHLLNAEQTNQVQVHGTEGTGGRAVAGIGAGSHASNRGAGLKVALWYGTSQRIDVYRQGVYIEAQNARFEEACSDAARRLDCERSVLKPTDGGEGGSNPAEFIPGWRSDHPAANYRERTTGMLHVVVKGEAPITMVVAPVVQISMRMDVTLEEFFGANLLRNLAFVLMIPMSSVRLVDVIPEDTQLSNRLLQEGASRALEVTLQIGEAPALTVDESRLEEVTDPAIEQLWLEGDPDTVMALSNNTDPATFDGVAPANVDAFRASLRAQALARSAQEAISSGRV